MTDRELLEAAAKAAGISWECFHGDVQGLKKWDGDLWNPLRDDGDALRLAVKLGLELSLWGISVQAKKGSRAYAEVFAGEDRPAATRRAIVRAAAAIKGEQSER